MVKKKRKTTKKELVILLLLLPLLIISFGTGYLVRQNTYPSPTPIPKANAENALRELQKYLKINARIQNSNDWDWIGENNTHTPLLGKQIIFATTNNNGMAKLGNVSSVNEVSKDFILYLSNNMRSFFLAQGFSESYTNTLPAFDEYNQIRIGMEKGELKCIVSFMANSDPFGMVFCGSENLEQKGIQREFKSLINEGASKTKSIMYLFRVEKIHGNYARGYESNFVGNEWFAKKENGKWNIVIRTPDEPLCSDVERYQIPKEIYINCYR